MAIFQKEGSKNRVYYRRKSIRLQSYALWLACGIVLSAAAYYVWHRNEGGK